MAKFASIGLTSMETIRLVPMKCSSCWVTSLSRTQKVAQSSPNKFSLIIGLAPPIAKAASIVAWLELPWTRSREIWNSVRSSPLSNKLSRKWQRSQLTSSSSSTLRSRRRCSYLSCPFSRSVFPVLTSISARDANLSIIWCLSRKTTQWMVTSQTLMRTQPTPTTPE